MSVSGNLVISGVSHDSDVLNCFTMNQIIIKLVILLTVDVMT